ncbi:MAG: MFS transporter [Dehalobacterium sp.]
MSIWTRNFILLCLANLSLFISMHILVPTLPVYLLEIGGSQKDVGFVMAAYTIGAMITRPLAGWLVDKFSRKRILIMGMVMMLSVSFFYRLANDVSLMMAVRCMHGLTFGIVSTAIGTMVVDNLPATRLGEGVGYFGLTSSLSMSLAPIIGFGLVGNFGYPILFLMVIILTTLTFSCTLTVRSLIVPSKTPESSVTGFWDSLVEKTALPPSKVMFFLAVVYGSLLSFISLYAAELGITNIGLFFTSMALAMLVSRPIAGRWADNSGPDMVLLIGHLAIFTGMVAIGLSHTITGLLLAGAATGLGFGFCMPTLQAMAVRFASAQRRGVATATFFIALDLGIGLGTILWGYVAEATGYQIMYFTTLIPIALAGTIYYRIRGTQGDGSPVSYVSSESQ